MLEEEGPPKEEPVSLAREVGWERVVFLETPEYLKKIFESMDLQLKTAFWGDAIPPCCVTRARGERYEDIWKRRWRAQCTRLPRSCARN